MDFKIGSLWGLGRFIFLNDGVEAPKNKALLNDLDGWAGAKGSTI
jgi:hypothetical protein